MILYNYVVNCGFNELLLFIKFELKFKYLIYKYFKSIFEWYFKLEVVY